VKHLWNWFDLCISGLWVVNTFFGYVPLNPTMLRLIRLVRLVRLVRLARYVETHPVLDPLNVMVNALRSSSAVLFWCLVVFACIVMVTAILVNQFLQDYIRETENETERDEVFKEWGTFTRSFSTVFEITLSEWEPGSRMLMDHVSEWWSLFFMGYKCVVGFAAVQIVISTFIQQTLESALRNEQIRIKEKENASVALLSTLGRLFDSLDQSGDGLINRDEFDTVLKHKRIEAWFAAVDIDSSEVGSLFDLLDEGSGQITNTSFLNAARAIKGPAKRQDVYALKCELQKINELLTRLVENHEYQRYLTDLAATEPLSPEHLRDRVKLNPEHLQDNVRTL